MPVATLPPRRAGRRSLPMSSLREPEPVAVLENGDRLTVSEFMRRYERMRQVKKAQLIEGIVHMPSPVRALQHAKPDGLLHGWLFTYALEHPELEFYPNATLLLDADNAPQPDSILCSAPCEGGRVWLDDKGYLCGKPELVCEVAASTASVDLHDKLRAYRRNGIQEYLVWLTTEQKVRWYRLVDQEYVEITEAGGKLRSEVFPGLVLDVKALLKHDGPRVIAALKARKH
ncbi:MAG: Uma2 family endonuclease [Prosthecobacter sp.]|uniref:Uma2 family endonuclease n=1 Tax=Prosthecobacter sp. TaxID=1965333 RepID=UPI003900344D